MLAAPWVCRRCLQLVPRPFLRQFVRRASSDRTEGRFPPILLQRARKLAREHDQLTASLAEDFDTAKAKRVGELSGAVSALKEWQTASDSIVELTEMVKSSDKEMSDLARDELETTEVELDTLSEKLSVALAPRDPYADMPCIMEFRPGPGGQEGKIFTDILLQMYKGYLTRKGIRSRLVSYTVADGEAGAEGENPLTEAVLEIQEVGAYDAFRGEAGMHRVQRVPPTEKQGRTHTSAVAVWVLPSFPETNEGGELTSGVDVNDPTSDFYIDPAEVKLETMRARGAGGQHVNKTESAIRLTHTPTGTVVSMQDHRSQQRNREEAWKLLRSRIAQQRREQREEEAQQLRSTVLSTDRITRGDKIRTYNYGQDRATDHRSGVDVHNLPSVLQGGDPLETLMTSVRNWLTARDLKQLIAMEEAEAAAAEKATAKKTRGKA